MTKIIALMLVASSFAFAANEEQELNSSTNTINTEIRRKNSAANRIDKNFTVTGEIVGMGPSGVIGQGLNIGFFINEYSLIQIDIHGGKNVDRDTLWSWGYDRETKEGFSIGAHYKGFVSNSFYFKGGFDYRSVDYEYVDDLWYTTNNDYITRSFSGESTTIGLSLGNQWQFGVFTLGCDWFGFQLPISSRVYDEKYSSNATTYDRRENKRDMKRYVTETSYTLTRFYLGASF